MSCEGKPETDAYRRFLEGHPTRRSEVEEVGAFIKGDLAAFRVQKRLVEEKLDDGDSLIHLGPRPVEQIEQLVVQSLKVIADNLR